MRKKYMCEQAYSYSVFQAKSGIVRRLEMVVLVNMPVYPASPPGHLLNANPFNFTYSFFTLQMVLKVSHDKKNVKIFSKDSFFIYGDLDVLVNMGFQRLNPESQIRLLSQDFIMGYGSEEELTTSLNH